MPIQGSLSKGFAWIWSNTDNISKWVQVAALMVAGYWSYTRFFKVEAPSLETVTRVEINKLRYTPSVTSCRLTIPVVIYNEGHTSFDVGRVQLRGWRSVALQGTVGNPAYFNVNDMRNGTPVLNADPPADLVLNRGYPPGSHLDQAFTWDFIGLHGLYLFEVDVYDGDDKPLGRAFVWDEPSCGQ
jgi:hypothetical protein